MIIEVRKRKLGNIVKSSSLVRQGVRQGYVRNDVRIVHSISGQCSSFDDVNILLSP